MGKPKFLKAMKKAKVLNGTKQDDELFATDWTKVINGRHGDDDLRGNDLANHLKGGKGDDFFEAGIGNDKVKGGRGNDHILSISWGGEPEIAQPDNDDVTKVEPDEPRDDNDIMSGGKGSDIFEFRWLIDAKAEILDLHRDANGDVDYQAVAGENGDDHDHWVETMGDDIVKDYNPEEDELIFEGHTVTLESATLIDADGDGQIDDTLLVFYSEQGGAGAHQDDQLGTVTFLDVEITAADVDINRNVFYGVEDPFTATG